MNNTFGQRLRFALDLRKRSIESLALDSGYSRDYISRLINGRQNNPTLFFVDCVARALNVSGAFLAGWSDNYEP